MEFTQKTKDSCLHSKHLKKKLLERFAQQSESNMAGKLVCRIGQYIQRIENVLLNCIFRGGYPPEGLCVAAIDASTGSSISRSSFSIKDLVGNGFLWAVPKKRRSVEKRLMRKFGDPVYSNKLLVPRRNLLVCNTCGHHYEAGHLCANCYAKVKEETKAMQDTIQAELGLKPIEQEVVVLYEGEKQEAPSEFWQGKRIVEMKKPRPSWFSKNLLQKSNIQPSTSTDVKPTELG